MTARNREHQPIHGHRTIKLRDGGVIRKVRGPRDPSARVVPLRKLD